MESEGKEIKKNRIEGMEVSPSIYASLFIMSVSATSTYYAYKLFKPKLMIRHYKKHRMIEKPRKWRRILRRRNSKK